MAKQTIAPGLGEGKDTPSSETYGRKKNEWEDPVCSCNTFLSATCCTFFFCFPCSLLCCIPHHAAAMARKIGWGGYANSRTPVYKAYTVNRKTLRLFACIVLFTIMVVLFLGYLENLCVLGVNSAFLERTNDHKQIDNTDPLPNGYCAPHCQMQMVDNGFCDRECNVTACNFDGHDCKPETIARLRQDNIAMQCTIPYGALLFVVNTFNVFIIALILFYFILLRFKMRKAFNIKASCCTSYGEVGEIVEDGICMTACFACATTQMSQQTDTQLECCCQGTAPEYLSSSVVSGV